MLEVDMYPDNIYENLHLDFVNNYFQEQWYI